MAQRIQLRRTKGWRKPDGVAVVSRPTKFGNPFPASYFGPQEAVRLYREWLAGVDHLGYTNASEMRRRVLDGVVELATRDLACWCPLDQPCHADVLLELANRES
jgi:hypothetical protein